MSEEQKQSTEKAESPPAEPPPKPPSQIMVQGQAETTKSGTREVSGGNKDEG